jgi:hypothetical protein
MILKTSQDEFINLSNISHLFINKYPTALLDASFCHIYFKGNSIKYIMNREDFELIKKYIYLNKKQVQDEIINIEEYVIKLSSVNFIDYYKDNRELIIDTGGQRFIRIYNKEDIKNTLALLEEIKCNKE